MVEIYRAVEIPEELKREFDLYHRASVILDEQGVHYGDIMVPGNPLYDLAQTLREPLKSRPKANPCGEYPLGA